MAGLTAGARASLAQVIEATPDPALGLMRAAVARMAGEKAAQVAQMLETAFDDRRRRAVAFRAVIPLFRPRADGLDFPRFPPRVLPRLWRAAADRDPMLGSMLDSPRDEDSSRRALARARLYAFAAEAVRTQPEVVWPLPEAAADIAAREAGLADLAGCCDLGMLAHRATRDLADWVGRPDEDRLAEFRLMVRDAASADADGVRRLVDILAAHVDEAGLVLRLAVHACGLGGEAMLRHSELAVVVERILDGFDERARRIAAFRSGDTAEPLRHDLDWCVSVLDAVDVAVHADPNGTWARRVSAAKAAVSGMIDERLDAADRTMGRVLPMRDAQTAGRMTRRVPRLDVEIDPSDLKAAVSMAGLIAAIRHSASRFGCEARRQSVLQELTTALFDHADLTLDALAADEAPDAALARTRATQVMDLLERMGCPIEARTVRRRLQGLRTQSAARAG